MSKTKKSLLLSCLSMLVCVTMLIGSTFAWFTDNASTGVNTIQAGTLDINVQYTKDGETWSALDNATDLFADALWEPGHTRVVALKVTNNGSLALKYQMGMNIVSETEGTNVYGDNFKLSDYLEVSTLAQQANDSMGIGDITLSLAFRGENAVGYEYTNKLGEVKREAQLFSGDSHYLIIKVDMPETVSNEANAQPGKAASIQFGINILATQLDFESDSFGNQYDAGASFPAVVTSDTVATPDWYDASADELIIDSAEDVLAMMNSTTTFEDKTIKLETDIDLTGYPFQMFNRMHNPRFRGTFDGQGHTIKAPDVDFNNGVYSYALGLFGESEDGAVFKNFTIDGMEVTGWASSGGAVVGHARGHVVFENITVKNTVIRQGRYVGGIVGLVSGNAEFINCKVENTAVLSIQNDNTNGPLYGTLNTDATVTETNCTKTNVVEHFFKDANGVQDWDTFYSVSLEDALANYEPASN